MASLLAFILPSMRGMWPSGGTWSARVGWCVNGQTHAVATVSRVSPCEGVRSEGVRSELVYMYHRVGRLYK